MTCSPRYSRAVAYVGEQQVAQALDADRVEGQQPGQRRGSRGVGVQILPEFVQFHRDGSGELRRGGVDAGGGVDEDELAPFEDPEDRPQALHRGVAAHRIVRQCG